MKMQLVLIERCTPILKKIIPWRARAFLREAAWEHMVDRSIAAFVKKKTPYQAERYPKGVNLLGGIRAEMGLGQSCRLVARELEQSNFDFAVYNVDFNSDLRENDSSYDKYIVDKLPYGINIFHVNPFELGRLFMSRPDLFDGHYNIAFWLWELEEFPAEWVKYCSLFDEIWTPSEFAGTGVKKKTNIPVKTVPYSVTAPWDKKIGRKDFGLPEDKFLYLVMYDANSTSGRKNPQGAIAAYKNAFPTENDKCGLVIKINNAKEQDLEALRKELSDYHSIYFITDILKKEQVNSLIKCVDVFVSLHRSEGFGLVMAEAMLLGTPVVATNWSSNTEFMSEDACCMVPYKLIENDHTEGLYRKGCIWADPDITAAAGYMYRLWSDPVYYKEKAEKGKSCVEERLNEEKILSRWNQLLRELNYNTEEHFNE